MIVALAIGLVAFLGRQPPEQIVVSGPVSFTSIFLPPDVEIELSREASAGFARFLASRSDTIDGKLLEKAAAFGTFHVQGRRFDWHEVSRVHRRHAEQGASQRVWHSQVLATMSASYYKVASEEKEEESNADLSETSGPNDQQLWKGRNSGRDSFGVGSGFVRVCGSTSERLPGSQLVWCERSTCRSSIASSGWVILSFMRRSLEFRSRL